MIIMAGGAIYVMNTELEVTSCTFTGNTVVWGNGGAIYADQGTTGTIQNNTIPEAKSMALRKTVVVLAVPSTVVWLARCRFFPTTFSNLYRNRQWRWHWDRGELDRGNRWGSNRRNAGWQ